ncbi:MAG: amidohydrolase [Bacteroidota bacterium]
MPTTVPTDLLEIRHHLHANPEVSGDEFKTAAFIKTFFDALQPDYLEEGVGGSGVVAAVGPASQSNSILFRAELDALPIQEINQFDHKSIIEGVSHKCGHDGHMTILLGLAQRLKKYASARLKGYFLFQPAEETGEGAKGVIMDSRFKALTPKYAFALHNLPAFPLGSVVIKKGTFTAAVKSMIIKLEGKTSHAAEPENGINPGLAIAEIISLCGGLSNPVSEADDFNVITLIAVKLGELAYGVSAGYGEVHLTMRAWTKQSMDQLIEELSQHLTEIAKKHQLNLSIEWTNEFEANENDDYAVEIVRQAAQNLNLEVIEMDYPLRWGEDFGAITQQCAGAMFGLGAGIDSPALHNPDYDFPDALLPIGQSLFEEIFKLTETQIN